MSYDHTDFQGEYARTPAYHEAVSSITALTWTQTDADSYVAPVQGGELAIYLVDSEWHLEFIAIEHYLGSFSSPDAAMTAAREWVGDTEDPNNSAPPTWRGDTK